MMLNLISKLLCRHCVFTFYDMCTWTFWTIANYRRHWPGKISPSWQRESYPNTKSCNENLFLSILILLHAWQDIQITSKMLSGSKAPSSISDVQREGCIKAQFDTRDNFAKRS